MAKGDGKRWQHTPRATRFKPTDRFSGLIKVRGRIYAIRGDGAHVRVSPRRTDKPSPFPRRYLGLENDARKRLGFRPRTNAIDITVPREGIITAREKSDA